MEPPPESEEDPIIDDDELHNLLGIWADDIICTHFLKN
jgi:hypothetical protein